MTQPSLTGTPFLVNWTHLAKQLNTTNTFLSFIFYIQMVNSPDSSPLKYPLNHFFFPFHPNCHYSSCNYIFMNFLNGFPVSPSSTSTRYSLLSAGVFQNKKFFSLKNNTHLLLLFLDISFAGPLTSRDNACVGHHCIPTSCTGPSVQEMSGHAC